MLKIGDKAIPFELPDSEGKYHKLSDFLGQKVVLYFYPKDNTTGCTTQALEFKRLFQEFTDSQAVIIGVSKDSVASHKKFKEKYELPFLLLSDESACVLNAYGVYKQKSMYGRTYMGIVRTTYVIDEEGKIISVWEKASSSKNPMESLNFIKG